MDTNLGNDLIESLNQAIAHSNKQLKTAQVHVVQVPNLRLQLDVANAEQLAASKKLATRN